MAKKEPGWGCGECGEQLLKWAGKCPRCGAFNSVVQLSAAEVSMASGRGSGGHAALIVELAEAVGAPDPPRLATGIGEVDRVLGGGLPAGATIVLGGEPGIGKSTLLAQVAGAIARQAPALYVTAEEGLSQVRARLKRVGALAPGLQLAAGGDARAIAARIATGEHRLAVVDSIQLLSLDGVDGEPGGVSQVRACAAELVAAAKRAGVTLVLVGHVTKDGSLAGPRLLEHLVDTVLAFEGDRYADLRVLRAVKNRFGATSEIGLLRMGTNGLEEVPDPSGVFIADRDASVAGSCVVPAVEGNRCLLVEVQALVGPNEAPSPARRVSGLDPNRVAMVLAVLARRLRLPLGTHDVYVNVTGGAKLSEPAADLAVALAVASAWRDVPIPPDLVAVGEVGLGGELRPAPRYELRATEARRLGFQRLVGPGAGSGKGRLIVTKLSEAVERALG
ncbi:MAG: DNA repair protein RadA [Planctomycetota bacterium]